jgi:hypothetical protein
MRRAALVALVLCTAVAQADDGLKPGMVLDATTAGAADALLPPEVVGRYKSGQFKNTIGEWPKGAPWDADFEAATAKNAGRYDVNARGTIVERGTDKQATGIYGLPFKIDPQDPGAGVKVMWNAYYSLWRVAGTHDVLAMVWIGSKAKQREAVLDSHLLFYEGAPPSRRRPT